MTTDPITDDRSAPPAALPLPLVVAAIASLGAGAVHAAAVGVHSEPRQQALAFALTALVQLGWGVAALAWRPAGPRRRLGLAVAGVVANGAALAGWVAAKTSGIPLVDGMGAQEDVQFADGLAAAFAAVAVAGALYVAVRPALAGRTAGGGSPASHARSVGPVGTAVAALAGVAAVALAVPAMITVGNHSHAGAEHADGDGHGHAQMATASGHDHGAGGGGEGEGEEAAAAATALPAEPYTGALPVDLGGVPGVTDEQRERAEALVTRTIQELPQFADPEDAFAAGYRSIGDAATGFEHMVRWDIIDDDVVYDPSQPESLVYAVDGAGVRTLEAAMFMLPSSEDIETAETPFGDLAQLHVHDNLCYAGAEGEWRVRAVVEPEFDCPDGSFRFDRPAPMVHVWIVGHRCGPFAALEGVGAGQIAAGDPRACDHAHAA